MSKPSRNALKGYTYQTYILTLLLALMDTKREICKLESEALSTRQFDDIFVETSDGSTHRVQAKNYPAATLDDITITDHVATICGNSNQYNPSDYNIMVINTDKIATDTEFMGIPATIKSGITIVPLTQELVADQLDNLFQNEDRELQIIIKAYELTCSAKFVITIDDLPKLITLSTDLSNKTILLREVPEQFRCGINYIIGKPGVGKSHYVEELTKVYNDAIVYRFWVSAHDEHLRHRLQYDAFLTDIGLKAFKSPRSFRESELAERLRKKDTLLIIDGLDHVENYNPKELSNYLSFLKLLEKSNIRTVVLSRPMKASLPWESTELINWNFSETTMYLAAAHNILDYDICKKIFECTNGYPIITYFLAEHFNKYDELNLQIPINDINVYYDELLKDVATKSALCIFASNNSFFTREELKTFFADPESYDMLLEFIKAYPYLFECVKNRISLVHDSLNTYLRCILSSYQERYKIVKNEVQNSLQTYEVEYMDRLSSFNFDTEFLTQLLIQYSNFDALRKLFSKTVDFNSITSFYQQLQRILEKEKNVLDPYQYYSFVLIFQIVTRNDLFGYEGLVYQILLYLHKHSSIENSIFSSGLMWNVYLLITSREELAEKFVADSLYGSHQYDSMVGALESEFHFFDCLKNPALYRDILEKIKTTEAGDLSKSDLLKEYLVAVSIHGSETDALKNEFEIYCDTSNSSSIMAKLRDFNMEDFYIKRAVTGAQYKLQELGMRGEKNMFRSTDLMNIIVKHAPAGSFETASIAQSYIRLANYENRIVDINSINFIWAMYAQRKDYSVHTLDTALILFEETGLLSESDSIEILNRLINQSEKGIRLLLSSYINAKGEACTQRLVETGKLFDSDFKADIFDLSPANLNCLSKSHIISRMIKVLYHHKYSKTLEISDMENVLMSDYCDCVLEMLRRNDYSFIGSTSEEVIAKIKKYGINISGTSTTEEREYVPFENGYIHDTDLAYIQENSIPLDECIKYADGWFSCMPFLSLFEMQDASLLKENCLKILHDAIFARVVDQQHIGNWYNLIGYIPKFLKICGVDIDWKIMFEILKNFFDYSLIYYPTRQGCTSEVKVI